MSTTVVFRYRVRPTEAQMQDALDSQARPRVEGPEETPEARAYRLTEKLRGLLKDELAEYGGGEAFIRWVRGYDEED
jgi:hypothetical protein